MAISNLGPLRAVADRLDRLGLNYAFTGGAIVNLLLDDPMHLPARPTDDIDVIIEVATAGPYSDVEARLRGLSFEHDVRPGAPLCRWNFGGLTVDIMPTDGSRLGLNTIWFPEALASAREHEIAHTRLRLVSPATFLATKCAAFSDRGAEDYLGSRDLEDLIAVIDGRAGIGADLMAAPSGLRAYVADFVRRLLEAKIFQDSLAGQLPSDATGQARLPGLRGKLQAIAAISAGGS